MNDENISKDYDRSNLGELYPKAKTIDEMHRDDLKRQAMYGDRAPKRPYITIPLYGGAVVAIMTFFIQNVARMWAFGDLGSVFFSFGIWIIIVGLIVLWVRHVNKTFYRLATSARYFWIGFAIIACLLIAAMALMQYLDISPVVISLSLGATSVILNSAYIFILFKLKSRRTSNML